MFNLINEQGAAYTMIEGPMIDENRCNKCGKCIEVCPKDSITIIEGKITHLTGDCILCSHCYAVCPTEAISFDPALLRKSMFYTFTIDDHRHHSISAQDFAAFSMERRSIRKYRETPVATEILRDLVEFATTAPSGSNCQNWEFTVIPERSKVFELASAIRDFFLRINSIVRNPLLRYLSVVFAGTALIKYYRDHFSSVELGLMEAEKGRDLLFHGAPALIIIHSDMEGSLPLEDGQYAAYNIALLAHAMGLGSCFIGYASETLNRSNKIKESVGIPRKNRVLAVLALGYPDVTFERFAMRKNYRMNFI